MTKIVWKILAGLAFIAPLAIAAAPPTPQPAAKQPPLARLAAAMAKAGVKRCAPIIQHVAGFLIENGDAAFTVKALGANADTSPTMLTLESSHATLGTTRYATVVVVPSESCSGYYEQSIFWPTACASVKATNFANFPQSRPLLRNIQASAASPSVSLLLMPAGTGCVSMKKEIFR